MLFFFLYPKNGSTLKYYQNTQMIVLGFYKTSTLVGHFVSSPKEREKRERRGDKREGQGRKRDDRKRMNRRMAVVIGTAPYE